GQSFFRQIPVKPGDRRILAISIIVPVLGLAELIPGEEHWNTFGKEKGGEKVTLLLGSKSIDSNVIRRSFYTTVPALVRICSIPIFFTIGLVMFVIVANQISQGEPIVSGNEINTGARPPSALRIKIAASNKP